VDLLAQADLGKFAEGPRKGGLRGHIGPSHKTTDAPKDWRRPQGLDSGPGVGVVIHRFADKGPGQGLTLPWLPPKSPDGPTSKFLDLDYFQYAD